MEIRGVPADQIKRADKIHHFFDRFTDRGSISAASLIEDVANRDRQCWIILAGNNVRAMALTRLAAGEMLVCEITHLSGDGLKEWHSAFLMIEKWALAQGCSRIKATARPGYARIGKQYGLKQTHVLLEKDL